jgi:hypothetical protein
MTKRTPTARHWQCWISTDLAKSVDADVDAEWRSAYHSRPPFGDLHNQWRRQHCRTLNPYGSEDCPYPIEACARAFLDAVWVTSMAQATKPGAYFMKVARTSAAVRADQAQENRRKGLTDRPVYGSIIRTGVPDEEPETERPGESGASTSSTEERPGLHSPQDRPLSIGEVLGQIDLGPRAKARGDGKKGSKH